MDLSAIELKIPPPVVALVAGVFMWCAASWSGMGGFFIPARPVLAGGLALTGLFLSASGVFSFLRAGTTIHPHKPQESSTLVVKGVYGWTRNPMYLGLLLVLCGWAVFLANVMAFVFLPLFVLYIYRFQILPEERILAQKFGGPYADYMTRVRRWI